jgi:exodeoxyribonuclease VII large subunit
MPKPVKSQWDFGELFPREEPAKTAQPGTSAAPAARKVLTVSELTLQVKRLLEQQVGQVWVTGEVTNFRAQSSGHFYFTLKDADSQLNCVLFRGEARATRSLVQEGRRLVVQGDLTVYEPRGQYQLRVTAVELEGMGALQQAFERLKQKLNAEGLFAQERKRPLPPYPQRIGIVTSPTGAAIRDVLHVVQRRNPGLEIILAPCRVQGQGAAEEIADAIRLLNEFNLCASRSAPRAISRLDLILVTRGGGSLEDLWAFNEEVVARAIFESKLPVVSAVGHEIDFTISDFVADFRAATPSAAAEIITEGVFSSLEFVSAAAGRIRQSCRGRVEDLKEETGRIVQRLVRMHPRKRFNERLQRLDDLQGSLARCLKRGVRQQHLTWRNLRDRLVRVRPHQLLEQRRELLSQEQRRLFEQARHHLQTLQNRLGTLDARLRLLGPEQVLARGYSITMDSATGKVIRAAAEVKPGQRLKTRLKAGEVRSRAEGEE